MEPEIGPGVLFFGIFRFGFGCRVLWPRLYERFVASIIFFAKYPVQTPFVCNLCKPES
jgi:hypothetical protein